MKIATPTARSRFLVWLGLALALLILMAIIGLASALRGESRGSQAQGLAAGIIIGFSYWIVFAFTVSLGRGGVLSPLLAAWSANILFGLAAGLLFLRVRT